MNLQRVGLAAHRLELAHDLLLAILPLVPVERFDEPPHHEVVVRREPVRLGDVRDDVEPVGERDCATADLSLLRFDRALKDRELLVLETG